MKPFINTGIGEQIKHELEFRGWTQSTLSEILKISEKHISKLVNNEVQLTIDLAQSLASLFEISAQTLLNIDSAYRLENSKKKDDSKLKIRAKVYSYLPIRELRKLGWIENFGNKTADLCSAVEKTFGKAFDEDIIASQKNMSMRSSVVHKDNFNQRYAAAWYLYAQKKCMEFDLPAYDDKQLNKLVETVTNYTKDISLINSFLDELKKCGVGFIYLPHLPQTYLDGAAFFHGNNPVIAYTGRYDRLDNFWFTILHELGHVLLGHVEHSAHFILDSLDTKVEDGEEKEIMANEFARQALCLDEIAMLTEHYSRVPLKLLTSLFKFFPQLHPSIIIGSLQFAGKISYKSYNNYNKKIVEIFID